VEITEVRIKLMEDPGERLQAFCSITFDDCFVVRDLKIIEGGSGPFVAMPSRKLTAHCGQCGHKNHLRAAYCNQCGQRMREDRAGRDEDGRAKLYADIAHPINSTCREMIQQRVVAAFQQEVERSKQPGYVSTYDDIDPEDPSVLPMIAARQARKEPRHAESSRTDAGQHAATGEQIQPPQRPHGPHRAPGRASVAHAPHATAEESDRIATPRQDAFGAGIF
jgi:stage V sporulation protein G